MLLTLVNLSSTEYFCLARSICLTNGIFVPEWVTIMYLLFVFLNLFLSFFNYNITSTGETFSLGIFKWFVILTLILKGIVVVFTVTVWA